MTGLLERFRPQWWYFIAQALYMVAFEVAWAGGNLAWANRPVLAILGVLGGLLYVVGDSIYIVETARGKLRPQRISWLIFVILNICNFANQYASGATNSLWLVAGATLTTAIVFVMSISRGVGGAGKLDFVVLVGAGAGIGLWALLDNPLASTICNVVVATVALVPTAKKTFYDPDSEDALAWLLCALSGLLAAASVGAWDFNLLLLPLHDFFSEIVIYGLIVFRKKAQKRVGYYDAAGSQAAVGRGGKIPGVDYVVALPAIILVGLAVGQMTLGKPDTKMAVVPTNNPTVLSETAQSSPSPTAMPTPSPPPATPAPTPVPQAAAPPAPKPAAAAPTEIAAPSVCPNQNDLVQAAAALVCLSSWARTFHGLSGFSANTALGAAAVSKAEDMATCGYSHTACGREFDYWISAKGFTGSCTAENIAVGQRTPLAVFTSWMNSAGHRANILNPSYRVMGVSQAAGPDGPLWAMELGGC